MSQTQRWCEYCKIYLANNAATWRMHEQGQRHKQNVTDKLRSIQKETKQQEKDKQAAEAAMGRIEQVGIDWPNGRTALTVVWCLQLPAVRSCWADNGRTDCLQHLASFLRMTSDLLEHLRWHYRQQSLRCSRQRSLPAGVS